MSGCKLMGAELDGCHLRGADLRGNDLSGLKAGLSNLAGVTLAPDQLPGLADLAVTELGVTVERQ
ncbi:pentapeptide repeat-containing protein [Micromonospora sp. NPDC093277]|uniref:pentapeptide repeat-containing protein n=1 Tax=Micromonospora sp. NPDC093277 TaxID=3364291 RepID=UPI00380D759A